MIVLIEIGNRYIKWANYSKNKIENTNSYFYEKDQNSITDIKNNFIDKLDDVTRALIANMASEQLADNISNLVWEKFQIEVEFIKSAKSSKGLKNGYYNYQLLGVDRWLNILGANSELDKKNKQAFCVINCSDAITVDAVDNTGKHIGGFIVPGLDLLAQSLVDNIHKVHNKLDINNLKKSRKQDYFLANNTEHAVAGGIHYLIISYLERILEDLSSVLSHNYKVYLTGSDAKKIGKMLHLDKEVIINQNLLWDAMLTQI